MSLHEAAALAVTVGSHASARIGDLATLPVFFKLDGRRVLLVGGGDGAAWKAELLAAAGADVLVCSDAPGDAMTRLVGLPTRGRIRLAPEPWSVCDMFGAALAIGAIDDLAAAARFAAAARAAGIPVNVVDKPEFCDFQFGALVNRSPLVIAISTDGAAPVFGQAIRARIETLLPGGFQRWAAAAKAWRAGFQKTAPDFRTRRRFWETFTRRALEQPDRAPSEQDFEACLAAAAAHSDGAGAPRPSAGQVMLVPIAAHRPTAEVVERLTLKAVRLLGAADVVAHDAAVPAAVLDLARRESRRLVVGTQAATADIVSAVAEDVRAGRTVVWLAAVTAVGADGRVVARSLAEEVAALAAAGLAVDEVASAQ